MLKSRKAVLSIKGLLGVTASCPLNITIIPPLTVYYRYIHVILTADTALIERSVISVLVSPGLYLKAIHAIKHMQYQQKNY